MRMCVCFLMRMCVRYSPNQLLFDQLLNNDTTDIL